MLAVYLLKFSSVVKCGFMPLEEHAVAIVHISPFRNVREIVIIKTMKMGCGGG